MAKEIKDGDLNDILSQLEKEDPIDKQIEQKVEKEPEKIVVTPQHGSVVDTPAASDANVDKITDDLVTNILANNAASIPTLLAKLSANQSMATATKATAAGKSFFGNAFQFVK